MPQARASWEGPPLATDVREYYLGHKVQAQIAGGIGVAPTFTKIAAGHERATTLQHFAICFSAPLPDGTQFVTKWRNGFAMGAAQISERIAYDPADYFRSSGFVDELRVSSTVRYTADFQPPRRFVSDVDTLALYHCDEGSGNVLIDASGRNNHGRLRNAKWALSSKFPMWVAQPVTPSPASAPPVFSPPPAEEKPRPGDDLYIYVDPFDVKEPVIDVDAIRYDGSTPLTIEAWIVGEPTPQLQTYIDTRPTKSAAAGFFELGGGDSPFAKVSWDIMGSGDRERSFSTLQSIRPHLTQAAGKPNYHLTKIGRGKATEFHHAALTFGKLANGRQYIGRWWDGYPAQFSRGFFETVFDPRDHLRSHGFVDELRVSKVERYKGPFKPERRFKPDADTLALYHCDEGSGDVLIDSSGQGRHGRLKNARWGPTLRYPIAEPVSPVNIAAHDPSRFVGGSSPDAPVRFEIIPPPPEVTAGSYHYLMVRVRNDSDAPAVLYSQSSNPTSRSVATFKNVIEFLDGAPGATPPRTAATTRPDAFSFSSHHGWPSELFELRKGDAELTTLELPITGLQPGRYRVRCRVIPHGVGLGPEQEAAFEFRVVDKAAADVPGDKVEWKWKGLEPLPAPLLPKGPAPARPVK